MADETCPLSPMQLRARRKLVSALRACAASGLRGGVFDGSFCLWPRGDDIAMDHDFFARVEKVGTVIICSEHRMHLDGGAGV